jgi:hypothetical protein
VGVRNKVVEYDQRIRIIALFLPDYTVFRKGVRICKRNAYSQYLCTMYMLEEVHTNRLPFLSQLKPRP